MGRIVKLIGIVAGAAVLLFVIAIVAVTMLFDPNDYKDEISAAVEQSTGRQLTLDGDLELDIFPGIRIALGGAALSNAAGFGAEPFAQIDGASLAVGLLPLLSRRIEIGEARLEGLVLNLERSASGDSNWQMGEGGTAEPAVQEDGPGDGAEELNLDVGAIVIADAEINWSDAAASTNWQLGNFNMDASGFGPGAAFPLELDFTLAGDAIDVAVDASMNATLGLSDNVYRLDDLDVEIAGSGSAWPGGEGEASLSFSSLAADLGAETVDLDDLALEILGLSIAGSLSGTQLFGDLTLAGAIEIEDFDPNGLLEEIGAAAIETADPDVLANASIDAELAYGPNRMMLEGLTLVLDDSELVGELGYVGDSLNFDLAIDDINIDRYLPPPAEGAADDEGSLDEVDLPLDALRTFNSNGRIAIAQTQFSGLTMSDVEFSLTAANGQVSLQPSAGLYGGTFGGDIAVAVEGNSANLSIEQSLSGVDSASLVNDLLDGELVSGTLDMNMDLSAAGANLGDVRRQLDGDVSFSLADGAWEGVDMWYELRRARAVFDSRGAPERGDGPPRTPISVVSMSGVLNDGVMTSQDLTADLDFMTATGGGTLNLVEDTIDFDVVASFVDGETLQSDPEMADLAGDELPLSISGAASAPSVRPDFSAMIRAEAEEALQQELEERLDEEDQEELNELEERLEGLRNIFDR
ncbi:MAG: AsmA family protein [Gammaproteobacteria bacterium]